MRRGWMAAGLLQNPGPGPGVCWHEVAHAYGPSATDANGDTAGLFTYDYKTPQFSEAAYMPPAVRARPAKLVIIHSFRSGSGGTISILKAD